MRSLLIVITISFFLIFPKYNQAQAQAQYAYYGFEPDIITNYINNKKKLGYIRIAADLMIKNAANLSTIEHHAPLLRDAIIDVLSKEPEEKIRSLTGREEIRLKCLQEIKFRLKNETGNEIIQDLLFTKYLYN